MQGSSSGPYSTTFRSDSCDCSTGGAEGAALASPQCGAVVVVVAAALLCLIAAGVISGASHPDFPLVSSSSSSSVSAREQQRNSDDGLHTAQRRFGLEELGHDGDDADAGDVHTKQKHLESDRRAESAAVLIPIAADTQGNAQAENPSCATKAQPTSATNIDSTPHKLSLELTWRGISFFLLVRRLYACVKVGATTNWRTMLLLTFADNSRVRRPARLCFFLFGQAPSVGMQLLEWNARHWSDALLIFV